MSSTLRTAYEITLTLIAIAVGIFVALISVPWIMWAMGRELLGDDAGCEKALAAAPLTRWMER